MSFPVGFTALLNENANLMFANFCIIYLQSFLNLSNEKNVDAIL